MNEQDQVLEQVAAWQRLGRKAALATVVSTWGSSPRPVGSQLGISETGEMVTITRRPLAHAFETQGNPLSAADA